ncbi:MAG: murein transglycosylase A [Thalassobaculales bacterium]
MGGRFRPAVIAVAGRRGMLLLAAATLAVLAGCAKPPAVPEDALSFAPARFEDLPGWQSDAVEQALPAFLKSCERLARLPDDRPLGDGPYGRAGDWRGVCSEAAGLPAGDGAAVRGFIEARFRPWAVRAGEGSEGLFTGYYEPQLNGSRTRHGPYTVPLYKRPPDLVTVDLGDFRGDLKGQRLAGRIEGQALKPYPDRARIEAGALSGRGLELVWVDDPVDAFFLHIQGSGRVVLDDGGVIHVGFAAQNGHPYVAIGGELVRRGELARDEVSMQAIRAWLARNSERQRELLSTNPSFVFFREIGSDGPLGAQGAPLTPGRSLAVDRSRLPLGAPFFVEAHQADMLPGGVIRRLMVAQDTGGAIRGPVRGDVFWGSGAEAAEIAGRMKARGRYWMLLPAGLSPLPPTS